MNRSLIKFTDHGSGFFSNFFSVLGMMIRSEQLKLNPYVDLSNTAFVPGYNPYSLNNGLVNWCNPWDWWFVQDGLHESDHVQEIDYSCAKLVMQNTQFYWGPHAHSIYHVYDKFIRIQRSILDEVDDHYNHHFSGKRVLGVMARGAEMVAHHPEYGDHNLERWIREASSAFKKGSFDCVFLVTEESSYVEEFFNFFGKDLITLDVFRRTSETDDYITQYPLWPCLSDVRENHERRLGEESLVQALLLSKCAALVGKQCGTVSAAMFFSRGKLPLFLSKTFPLFNSRLSAREKTRHTARWILHKLKLLRA